MYIYEKRTYFGKELCGNHNMWCLIKPKTAQLVVVRSSCHSSCISGLVFTIFSSPRINHFLLKGEILPLAGFLRNCSWMPLSCLKGSVCPRRGSAGVKGSVPAHPCSSLFIAAPPRWPVLPADICAARPSDSDTSARRRSTFRASKKATCLLPFQKTSPCERSADLFTYWWRGGGGERRDKNPAAAAGKFSADRTSPILTSSDGLASATLSVTHFHFLSRKSLPAMFQANSQQQQKPPSSSWGSAGCCCDSARPQSRNSEGISFSCDNK